jgi:hypothetical protein
MTDTSAIAAPTKALFHSVGALSRANANIDVTNQIPAAVLTKRKPGSLIAIVAPTITMMPMSHVFTNWGPR